VRVCKRRERWWAPNRLELAERGRSGSLAEGVNPGEPRYGAGRRSATTRRSRSLRSRTAWRGECLRPAHETLDSRNRDNMHLTNSVRLTGAGVALVAAVLGCSASMEEDWGDRTGEEAAVEETSGSTDGGEQTSEVRQAACTSTCGGTAFACDRIFDSLSCNLQLGCRYSSSQGCIGSATACGSLVGDECFVQAGCIPSTSCQPSDAPPVPTLYARPAVTLGQSLTVSITNAPQPVNWGPEVRFDFAEHLQGTQWSAWKTTNWGVPYETFTPSSAGVKQYRARTCFSSPARDVFGSIDFSAPPVVTCSAAATIQVEAQPTSSSYHSTFNIEGAANGQSARLCPTGTAVTGFACANSYCGTLTARCGDPIRKTVSEHRTPPRCAPGSACDVSWTQSFSEEGGGKGFCPTGKVVGGVQCFGRNCDSIQLACVSHERDVHPTQCRWSGWHSEEQAPFFTGASGAIVGAQCAGSYCDNKRYYHCDFAAGTQSPGRVPITGASFDGTWLYMQWTPVPNDPEFMQFVIGSRGGVTKWLQRKDEGASDRGSYRYRYYHRSEICGALGAGTHSLTGQIWPGSDSSRAGNTSALGSVTCP
jgi:hypothetical protein